jgi:hypothetical protein
MRRPRRVDASRSMKSRIVAVIDIAQTPKAERSVREIGG